MAEEVRILLQFKEQIFECIRLVCDMNAQDKIKAVQFWNESSVRLQVVFDKSSSLTNLQNLREDMEQILLDNENQTVLGVNQIIIDQVDRSEEEEEDDGIIIDQSPSIIDQSSNIIDQSPSIIDQSSTIINQSPSIIDQSSSIIDQADSNHQTHSNQTTDQDFIIITKVNTLNERDEDDIQSGDEGKEVSRFITLDEDNSQVKQENFFILEPETVLHHEVEVEDEEEEDCDNDEMFEGIGTNSSAVKEKVVVLQNSDLSINFQQTLGQNGSNELDDSTIQNKVFEIRRKHSLLINNAPSSRKRKYSETETSRKLMVQTESSGGVDVVYECKTCFKTFPTLFAHTAHSWCHTKPFKCETCEQSFATKGTLTIHNRKHSGEKPFNCKSCSAKFTTHGNLKRHMTTHTGAKPWICELCNARFTEKKSLKIHMRVHTGEKPYACSICNQRFSQQGTLKSHFAVHNKKKPHLCDLCGRSFSQKSNLKAHKSRHLSHRNFNCDYCDSKFHNKGDLIRHMKGHTGVKNLSLICTVCMKSFSRKNNLTDHMNKHNNIKPWECALCHETFFTRRSVFQHLKDAGDTAQHAAVKTRDPDLFVLNAAKQDRQFPPQVVNLKVVDDEEDPDDVEEEHAVEENDDPEYIVEESEQQVN